MCISREDIAPFALYDSSRQLHEKLLSLLSSTCVKRVVLSVSYLFSFSFCDEFLKTYFLSMPQLRSSVNISVAS